MFYSNNKLVKALKFNQQKCPVLANAFHDLWGPLFVKPQLKMPEFIFFISSPISKTELWHMEFLQQDIITKYMQKGAEISLQSSGFRLCTCSQLSRIGNHLTFLSISL